MKRVIEIKPAYASRPGCCTPEQYAAWTEAALATVQAQQLPYGICCDCVPAWKALHERTGHCTHPEIRFRRDEDGFVAGFVPSTPYLRKQALPRAVLAQLRKVAA